MIPIRTEKGRVLTRAYVWCREYRRHTGHPRTTHKLRYHQATVNMSTAWVLGEANG